LVSEVKEYPKSKFQNPNESSKSKYLRFSRRAKGSSQASLSKNS
jgi:hypothetical protein